MKQYESQIFTLPSKLPLHNLAPNGSIDKDETELVCPISSASTSVENVTSETFTTLIIPSSPPQNNTGAFG